MFTSAGLIPRSPSGLVGSRSKSIFGSIARKRACSLSAASTLKDVVSNLAAPCGVWVGRWTVLDAIEKDVAVPVIAFSLFTRFRSRVDPEGRGSLAERLLAALRNEFGGHTVVENRE
jgi:hypothetical protein